MARYLLQAPDLDPDVSSLRALHLDYPDATGRWPWDPGTTSTFRALQPAPWFDDPAR